MHRLKLVMLSIVFFSKTRSTSCWRDLILLTLVSVGEGQVRGVPYGDFAMSVVRELLGIKGIKFDGDDDLISAAHHIAGKMEKMKNG